MADPFALLRPPKGAFANPDKSWSEAKWVWIVDKQNSNCFIAANVKSQEGEIVQVKGVNEDTVRSININLTEKMNPPKFDKVEDMADLSYLNEASVLHNLRQRYLDNFIYTYSGLFLVAVNPYHKLQIYTDELVAAYKNKKRNEAPPHIYSIADAAYRDMLTDRTNQSILITGESGAGKTENTKKVIQYLTSIAQENSATGLGTLEQKILEANPILEAFGNAQTVKNNNSSRFGKFVKIEFNASGQITGGHIDWYLLEKSRVTHQTSKERGYHIFYQLLKAASAEIKDKLLLTGSAKDYNFLKDSNHSLDAVDDVAEFKAVQGAFKTMGISNEDCFDMYRILAVILHLGNITCVSQEHDQAELSEQSNEIAERICHLIGVPVTQFVTALVRPQIKAGRDWVVQSRNAEQVIYSIEALSRSLYERMFGKLVETINLALDCPKTSVNFIGVLDIAGFEIFENNTFEQLNINYTNEKLQQFFNHHMFVLEQEEYRRENIEWTFIDFGLDLQPTVDLIESTSKPIGILSLLDEECVMPKASDKTFSQKVFSNWNKSKVYEKSRFDNGFIVHHYAGNVEYEINGWLDKNKDPLNENVTRLLAVSTEKSIASMFSEYLDADEDTTVRARAKQILKKGAFRTVAQRHREQLSSLMAQLHSTSPHFVRCIVPNSEKKAGKFNAAQVLDQLRCNGVLEGIRICRQGYPNRLPFAEFRQRYEILTPGQVTKGFVNGRTAAETILKALKLEDSQFKLGNTKVFFKAGVLAELEDRRDVVLSHVLTDFQALARGFLARRAIRRRGDRTKAIKVIQRNARVYVQLKEWKWWKLYSKVKPLLNVSRVEDELKANQQAMSQLQQQLSKQAELLKSAEASKASLEAERLTIEEQLVSERNAATSQADILARSKARELALEEAIKQLDENIEALESNQTENKSKIDKLMSEIQAAQADLNEATASVARFQRETLIKDSNLEQLRNEVQEHADSLDKLRIEKRNTEAKLQEQSSTMSQLEIREKELLKLKSSLQQELLDTKELLERESGEKSGLAQKRSDTDKQLQQTLNDLAQITAKHNDIEHQLKRKEAEVSSLQNQLNNETSARDTADKSVRDLDAKLQSAEFELESERAEKNKLIQQKKLLDNNLQEMRNLVDAKGSEESRQAELKRLRDAEVVELNRQVAALQQDTESNRQSHSNAIESIRTELNDATAERNRLKQIKTSLESRIKELESENEEHVDAAGKAAKNLSKLQNDLEQSRISVIGSEGTLAELKVAKETLERQLQSANNQLDETKMNFARVSKDKSAAEKQLEVLQSELEDELIKKNAAETSKKRLSQDLEQCQVRLEDSETTRIESIRSLALKSAELDTLKDRYQQDATDAKAQWEEAKRVLEKELHEAQARNSDLQRQNDTLEKTKVRLINEIEDMKHEVDTQISAVRTIERSQKQTESQMVLLQAAIEKEKKERDNNEAGMRKLQNQLDKVQLELVEKDNALSTSQRAKEAFETELKSLIDDIGDTGRNVHELEKAKKKLEARIQEMEVLLEEQESARQFGDSQRKTLEDQYNTYRRKMESEYEAKDAQFAEVRSSLMREINELGMRLDEEQNGRSEWLKQKKKLEAEIEDLNSKSDISNRSSTDVMAAKKKAEAVMRDLQSQLEAEVKQSQNLGELSARLEKKSNTLQAEYEKLEAMFEASERQRKQAEKRAEDLHEELEGGEGSKTFLADAKRKLEKEVAALKSQLEEEADIRSHLELNQRRSSLDGDEMRKKYAAEAESRIERIEESRKAAIAAQRLCQQELDDQIKATVAVEKHRTLLQEEIEETRQQLEEERAAKESESSLRRQLSAEQKELQIKLEALQLKLQDSTESIAFFRNRADTSIAKLEAAEVALIKLEKNESSYKAQIGELEESLNDAEKARVTAESKVKAMEDQITILKEKVEEDAVEISEITIRSNRLQQDLNEESSRYKRDISESESTMESMRRKYQKDLKAATEEAELEKLNSQSARESVKRLDAELAELNIKYNQESEACKSLRKDKERLEIRLIELTKHYESSNLGHDELQVQIANLSRQARELRQSVDESESRCAMLEKSKKIADERYDQAQEHFLEASRSKQHFEKSFVSMQLEFKENQKLLEETQESEAQASERIRRAEIAAAELQTELTREREASSEIERSKIALDRQVKELNIRILDLEGSNTQDTSKNAKRLEVRIEELSGQLDAEIREKNETSRLHRIAERAAKNLQTQVTDFERSRTKQAEEITKLEEKLSKGKKSLEELEHVDTENQLARRRIEREATELRDRLARAEKENERLKGRVGVTA